MGFYLRKSVRVGPFRFNLSKSGLGVSVGVTGLRIGAGPRGNYVHMGREGLYFRSALPSNPTIRQDTLPSVPRRLLPHVEGSTLAAFEEIESGDVVTLTDSTSSEIVDQLAAKAKAARILPGTIAAGAGVLALLLYLKVPVWWVGLSALVGVAAAILAARRDIVARSVVLLYDLDDGAREAYERLHGAFDVVRAAERLWHVDAEAEVLDGKYHAGASTVVNRELVSIRKGEPPILKTNVEAVLLPAGRQLLAFMPDRLLIFERGSAAGIDYANLALEVEQTQFIENGPPPPEARIVGSTWRFVNKKGGPDRRFANNPEMSIALYEQFHFRSTTGLNERFQCSRLGVGGDLQVALAGIAEFIKERQRNSTPPSSPPPGSPP